MNDPAPTRARPPITIERTYEVDVEDLWALWTTKEGFESWWGPKGFRVEVHAIELRVGGTLFYDMIAEGSDEIALMQRAGMPLSHETRATFVEVQAPTRLEIRHIIDFVPGLPPYENNMLLELLPEGKNVRMRVTIDRHSTDEWTERAVAGFASQLTKVPDALAARRSSK
jgi:uncharacterized protein YndB with AHSA1/START domain